MHNKFYDTSSPSNADIILTEYNSVVNVVCDMYHCLLKPQQETKKRQ